MQHGDEVGISKATAYLFTNACRSPYICMLQKKIHFSSFACIEEPNQYPTLNELATFESGVWMMVVPPETNHLQFGNASGPLHRFDWTLTTLSCLAFDLQKPFVQWSQRDFFVTTVYCSGSCVWRSHHKRLKFKQEPNNLPVVISPKISFRVRFTALHPCITFQYHSMVMACHIG